MKDILVNLQEKDIYIREVIKGRFIHWVVTIDGIERAFLRSKFIKSSAVFRVWYTNYFRIVVYVSKKTWMKWIDLWISNVTSEDRKFKINESAVLCNYCNNPIEKSSDMVTTLYDTWNRHYHSDCNAKRHGDL